MAVQEHPRAVTRRQRRLWALALVLYAAIGLADLGWRLDTFRRAGEPMAANIPVAFAAGLFWPADLVARILLAR
jgi:hypothetical protein